MAFPLCNEHKTLLLFTGKTWCGMCRNIAGEIDAIHLDAATSNDYHFMQIDDSDRSMLVWFKQFAIAGVPMFLIHDPQTRKLMRYDGNRVASEIINCIRNQNCTGSVHTPTAQLTLQLVPHRDREVNTQVQVVESKAQDTGTIDVCGDHPSYIVFTSQGCPACVAAKPDVERLQRRHGAHMQTLEASRYEKLFEALDLQYVPTFLYYDPRTKILRKISRDQLEQNLEQQPVWQAREGVIRPRQCPAMSGACPAMTADCPSMSGDCPSMSGECPEMSAECPAMTASFDAATLNPRALEMEPGAVAQVLAQTLKDKICENVVVDVCRSCPTFFIFTGTNWCTECQMFVPELIKLKQNARCGLYHVNHFDTQIGLDNFSRRVCRAFQVEKFPTVLLFDPASFSFFAYTSMLRFKDLRHVPELLGQKHLAPSMHNVSVPREVSFRVAQPSVDVTKTVMQMRLCADCPTVLIFAVHMDKYEKSIKQNGKGLHVIGFPATDLESRQVYDAFKINTVPKVLIYNPHMGNFYVFDGAHKDVPTTAAAAYKHVKARVWRDTPAIVVQR